MFQDIEGIKKIDFFRDFQILKKSLVICGFSGVQFNIAITWDQFTSVRKFGIVSYHGKSFPIVFGKIKREKFDKMNVLCIKPKHHVGGSEAVSKADLGNYGSIELRFIRNMLQKSFANASVTRNRMIHTSMNYPTSGAHTQTKFFLK